MHSFRATYDALKAHVVPGVLGILSPGTPLRVWVPGCSSGEFVYSIAICLLQLLEEHREAFPPPEIFGTDPDGANIARARLGKYPLAFGDETLHGYFSRTDDGYCVAPRVRNLCVFALHDLTRDPPLSAMHVVCCGDLGAYAEPADRERILSALTYALEVGGLLWPGTWESPSPLPGFSLVDEDLRIHRRGTKRSGTRRTWRPAPASSSDDGSPPRDETHGPRDIARSTPIPAEALPGESVEDGLRRRLAVTTARLETAIAERQESTARLAESNDRLARANEELAAISLDLKASNDELHVVNQEICDRNAEVIRLANDVTNVLASVEIPIVLVDGNLRIRRFTPAATEALQLAAEDIGGPLAAKTARVAQALSSIASESLERAHPVESNVQDESGRWHLLTARPYLTLAREVEGAVLSVLDLDASRESAVREAREYTERIIDSVSECVVVLDRGLRVQSANLAFYGTFALPRRSAEGRPFSELGPEEWRAPAFLEQLSKLRERDPVEHLRFAHANANAELRSYRLTARRIERTALTLVVIEDVTEAHRARQAAQQSEAEFRELMMHATECILTTDPHGTILFANHAAASLFGFRQAAMIGLPIEELVPEAARQRHVRHRSTYMAAPTARPLTEVVGRRRDGSTFPAEVVLSPVASAEGHSVVCFVTDMTARREAADRIRTYQEKLKQMAFDSALAEERERRRIAIDLHDRIGQSLALARMKLEAVREGLTGRDLATADEAAELVSQCITEPSPSTSACPFCTISA